MSVIDQFNKLLGKKTPASAADAEAPPAGAGLGDLEGPDNRMAVGEGGQFSTAQFPDSKLAVPGAFVDEPTGEEKTELLNLPVLGARTTAQHQRILAVALGVALVVLTGVTFFALNQADKVAQQVATTGQRSIRPARAENRAEETCGIGVSNMARWNAAPAKTDSAMVHIARGLAWSWAASSTLVSLCQVALVWCRHPV